MQRKLKARVGAAATGGAALVSVLLVPVTNYASEHAPVWARDPEALWLAFALLTLASVGLSLLCRRLEEDPAVPGDGRPTPVAGLAGAHFDSLRPPYVDPGLVRGRDAELSRLGALLRRPRGRFAVVCAAGGFGKTTVAAALAQRARDEGCSVFWIRWHDMESLAKQMTQAAVACGLPQEELKAAESGHVSLPDLVWRQLSRSRKWLLVVDNVDQAEQLGPADERLADYRGWVRPDGGGLLLVTSRDMSAEAWGGRAQITPLDSLDAPSGAQVLCDRAPESGTRDEALDLAERLGNLPLALHTVSAYLARPGSRYRTFAEYRHAMDGELPSLLGAKSPHASDPEVARRVVRHTWELSLDQLESEGVFWARPLMRVLSLFADAPVPRTLVDLSLLRTVTGRKVKRAELEEAFSGLERYGLIECQPPTQEGDSGTILMHSLIREITALSLNSPDVDLKQWKKAVVGRLVEVTEKVTPERSWWPSVRALADHAQLIFENRELLPFDSSRGISRGLLLALYAAGEYSAAVSVARAAHESDARTFGADHPRTVRSRFEVARALNFAGRNAESVRVHREILEHRAATLGAQHYLTVLSRDSLAVSLSHLGHHDEAVVLLREVLEQRVRVSGPDHVQSVATRNSIANVLDSSGRHAEAARMHREILEHRARTHGDDDFRTVQSRHNVATALDNLGQHEEAAELFRQVLDERTRAAGPEHLQTVTSRNSLGRALFHLGRYEEAAELLGQVLEQRRRTLGPEHPHTLDTRDLLESVRARLGAGRLRRLGRGLYGRVPGWPSGWRARRRARRRPSRR